MSPAIDRRVLYHQRHLVSPKVKTNSIKSYSSFLLKLKPKEGINNEFIHSQNKLRSSMLSKHKNGQPNSKDVTVDYSTAHFIFTSFRGDRIRIKKILLLTVALTPRRHCSPKMGQKEISTLTCPVTSNTQQPRGAGFSLIFLFL